MKLTKKIRHQVYVRALHIYRDEIIASTQFIGLCWTLYKAARTLHLDVTDEVRSYPEIYKHKPNDCNSCDFWFPYEDTYTRIAILKQAIKETE